MSLERAKEYWYGTVDYLAGKRGRVGVAVGGATLALVAACTPNAQPTSRAASESSAVTTTTGGSTSAESSTATSTAITSSSSASTKFILTPNLSGFLERGTTDRCYNTGKRPCAIVIRVLPKLSSDVINAPSKQSTERVTWPLESYQGSPADPLTADCYDPNGDEVKAYEGSLDSTVWFEVEVAYDHILNPTVKAQVDANNVGAPDSQKIAYGWVAGPWVGLDQSPTGMDKCPS